MTNHIKTGKKLQGVRELAQQIGVSPQSIYRWYHAGIIPGVRVGKLVRFDADLVTKLLAEGSIRG